MTFFLELDGDQLHMKYLSPCRRFISSDVETCFRLEEYPHEGKMTFTEAIKQSSRQSCSMPCVLPSITLNVALLRLKKKFHKDIFIRNDVAATPITIDTLVKVMQTSS